ncbi:MAG: twitching motility protein PilT [Acidobacteria bacterium]|nr:MAG: twitching motility protein PilT [Acidobacteriota bacterium]
MTAAAKAVYFKMSSPVSREYSMATFRFYAQLNDFLPHALRHGRFAHPLRGPASVKDAIESLGVPHPEVDVITVNGEAAGFTYRLRDGDHVCVYPVFRQLDLGGLARVGTDPPRPVRFALDIHLRKLASLLRLAGFDAMLLTEDAEVAETSAAEGRVALTRDVGLLKRSVVQHGRWIRNTDPELQLAEVLDRFDLASEMTPFTRCMECNTPLVRVDENFHRCPGCERLYWRGSHYDRLVELLERTRARLAQSSDYPIDIGE